MFTTLELKERLNCAELRSVTLAILITALKVPDTHSGASTLTAGQRTVTSASYQPAFISFAVVLRSLPLKIPSLLLSPLLPFTSNSTSAKYPEPFASSALDKLEITLIMSESVKFHV